MRKKKVGPSCLPFSVLCDHIVPHSEKECKGMKLAVSMPGLHSYSRVPSADGVCPHGDMSLVCFLRVAFPPLKYIYMSAENLSCIAALQWFQRQI